MTVPPLAAGLRPLTADDAARLEWLRGQLRSSRADISSPAGLGALVEASRAGWLAGGGNQLPEGMLAALSVGLGDLLVALAPGAAWVMHAGQGTPGPAVVDATGQAVVLPFADLRSRWISGRTEWVPGYVDAAAAHLRPAAGDVPHQRPAAQTDPVAAGAPNQPAPNQPAAPAEGAAPTHADTVADPPVPSAAAAQAAPAVQVEPQPTPAGPVAQAAWTPSAAQAGQTPSAEQAGWTPSPVPAAAAGGAFTVAAPTPGSGASLPARLRPAGPTLTRPDAPGRIEDAPGGPALAPPHAPAPGLTPRGSAPADAPRPASPADLEHPPSPRVQNLVLRALEAALDEVVVGGRDLPFALVPDGESWHLEHPEAGGIAAARAWTSTSGASHAAVAWAAELDGETAVYAEACDAGSPGLVVAHRYADRPPAAETGRRRARARVAEAVGDLVLIGQSAPLL